MTNGLLELIENRTSLVQVHYENLGHRLVSRIFLTFFGDRHLSVSVNEDTDEVVLGHSSPPNTAEDVSTVSPWVGVIGKPLYAAWSLENNNGHSDAFQFDFCSTAAEESRIVQLYGIASTLRVFVLVDTN